MRSAAASASTGEPLRRLQARYDAAATNDSNRRHWANADGLSADASATPEVRARIRNRARYEVYQSNAFAYGIVRTLANYLVGPGPRLKLIGPDRQASRKVQQAWHRWARMVKLAKKLRTMRMAKATDGEGIAVMINNPRLRHPVKLDLDLREADQMTTPELTLADSKRVDGIDFDSYNNPLRYWFLDEHPGSTHLSINPFKATPVDARHVIHLFREDRPGQRRGVSELAPALPLFALIRRYVQAVLGSAETAANIAGVMYTDSPVIEPDSYEALDAIELEARAMLTLPQGWKLDQIKSEQPTTTFAMFREALWNEAARCVLMPMNIAAGNSSGYNFASGRLDHQAFDLAIDTDRCDLVDEALEPIFEAWLAEYLSVTSGIASRDIDLSLYEWRWYWPPREHVDPLKQANADIALWERGLLSDDDLFFARGVDPEEQYESLERQLYQRRRLGLPLPGDANQSGSESKEEADDGADEDADDEAAGSENDSESDDESTDEAETSDTQAATAA